MKRSAVFALLLIVSTAAGLSGARAQEGQPSLAWLDPPRAVPAVPYLIDDGNTQMLESFRGKVVVLNFWATWCPPCIAEMPSLDALAGDHASDHLAVVTMAMDRASEQKIVEFYERIGANHLGIFRDPDMTLAREMLVFGLPTTLLIDHEGKVVAQLVGEADWNSEAALADILPLVDAARQASTSMVEQAALGD